MEEQVKEKKAFKLSEDKLELIIAIFLAVTAFLTAWAGWIGSLHGGNQATNYAVSNNLSSEGNSVYNDAEMKLMQDMLTWNEISEYQLEILYADACIADDPENEDKYLDQKSLAAYKLYYTCVDNFTEDKQYFAEAIGFDCEAAANAGDKADFAIDWLYNNSGVADVSPFNDSEFVDEYYSEALGILSESNAKLEEGKSDNQRGDSFNLVTVFYSVVLFLLGIAGTFKKLPGRTLVTCAAIVCFLLATVYMFTIPMPTGFNFGSFFVH
ncbi:MAG: hypothetical protein KBS85_02350 [Lachnospiraceae bacterium]|nr:hypothetical protein [Candidatus Merdinaster equi]